jgi:hypothetical protein
LLIFYLKESSEKVVKKGKRTKKEQKKRREREREGRLDNCMAVA